jgi:hypothetical protein
MLHLVWMSALLPVKFKKHWSNERRERQANSEVPYMMKVKVCNE